MNAASCPRDPDLMGPPPRRWGRLLLLGLVGAFCGLGAGFGIGRLVKVAGRSAQVTWADEASLALAALLGLSGGLLLLTSLSRTGAAYMTDPHTEGARALRPPQLAYFRLQGLVLFLAGGAYFIPAALPLILSGGGQRFAIIAYLGVLVLFAVQTGLNVALWRRSDELIRRTIVETGAISFWVLQGGVFLWAAGERLVRLPPLTSWDTVTVLMSLYLIASSVVALRRGLN